ncbi:MAG: TonB-dependent receptor, partial [Myxococcaceae bacterium]
RGRKAAPPRSASDFVLEREVLAAAPHRTAGDLLGSAPGVYIAQPEGSAVAHQIYLRGFDAEHGQDIELTAGPVPINQPSHIHGQGYADLNFIIPEVVRSLRVTEGIYDPRQGDFAVAGSVHFDLGVPARGYRVQGTYGSFDTWRAVGVYAPPGASEETFGAIAIQSTRGFGQNRGALSGSAIGQLAFDLPNRFNGLFHVAAYGARANTAGILRRDDVAAGRVGFYDSYPDPTANAQSAFASRAQSALVLERTGDDGSRLDLATFFTLTHYRSRLNFTGYQERSRENPDWTGRGDLVEQGNRALGLGARASHRTARLSGPGTTSGQFEMGLSLRTERIDQVQNLLQTPDNQTWDRRIDADIQTTDVGAYADADLRWGSVVHLRGGVRADVLHFDVTDTLANRIPRFQQATFIPGFRRTALGVAIGPRATLEADFDPVQLLASYGEGFRSPQALQLEEGENAPFTKVRGVEIGGRYRPRGGERFALTAAGYFTTLSSDLAFDPTELRLERLGPTRRLGGVAHLLARPFSWLLASVSATFVHATLLEPPPATPDNPSPQFTPGQRLPYVPPWVVRADASAQREFDVWGLHVDARLGTGFTFLSPRPLPYGRFAEPVALWDVSLGLRARWVELTLDVFNVLGSRYAAVEYSFVSNWDNRDVPSLLPARHFAAGPPRAFQLTLGFHL